MGISGLLKRGRCEVKEDEKKNYNPGVIGVIEILCTEKSFIL